MSTNNFVILSSKKHPLYKKLKALDIPFYDLEDDDPFEGKEARYREADVVFDFTFIDHKKKERLLEILAVQLKAPVVTDTSTCWGEYFCERYENVQGAVAAAFYSPQNKIEVFAKEDSIYQHVETLLKMVSLSAHRVQSAGHGFIYPRTISLLINEAYLAMEDQLASSEDLDTAMKYGVNYPHGLVEWCEKIKAAPIVELLDGLHKNTKDDRYRVSTSLRKKALLEN